MWIVQFFCMFYLFYSVNSPEGNLGYLGRVEKPQGKAGPLACSRRDMEISPFRKLVEPAHMPLVPPRDKPSYAWHRASVRMAGELQLDIRLFGADRCRIWAMEEQYAESASRRSGERVRGVKNEICAP
jgi:hypothetical protein